MSYIQKSLGQGEQVVALAHFHWWYDVKTWTALVIPVALLIFIGAYFSGEMRMYLGIAGLVLLLLGLIVFLQRMIRKWTTEIGVTSHRFVKKTGLFTLHTNEFALNNVEGVKVSQTFWGQLWGYGHLKIEGTGDDSFLIPDIADPIGFRRAIETAKGIKA